MQIKNKSTTKSISALKIGISATGTHHVQVSKLEVQLENAAGKALTKGEATPHILRILPHHRVFVDVPLDTKNCAKAKTLLTKVYAEGLEVPYEQRISLIGKTCSSEFD